MRKELYCAEVPREVCVCSGEMTMGQITGEMIHYAKISQEVVVKLRQKGINYQAVILIRRKL
jgi:hypothetical protein